MAADEVTAAGDARPRLGDEPLAWFASHLRDVRLEAGNPSLNTLVRLTKEAGRPQTRSTIGAKLQGESRPDWEFVEAFLAACRISGGAAIRPDVALWKDRHRQMLQHLAKREAGRRRAAIAAADLSSTAAVQTVSGPHVLLGASALTARAAELTELAAWQSVDGANLLCISGLGGQGKSALAWEHFRRSESDRLWHGFGLDTDPYHGLTASLQRFAESLSGAAVRATARALEVLCARDVLVVLDGMEHLYGVSDRIEDIDSSSCRTIADIRLEAIIRQLCSADSVKLLVTARLSPAFLDDPGVAPCVRQLRLPPIAAAHAAELWEEMGVPGIQSDFAVATTLLRGSPLLMRVAGRSITARGAHPDSLRRWLDDSPRFVGSLADNSQFRSAVLVDALRDVGECPRNLLLALAVARRRLSRQEWLALDAAQADAGGDTALDALQQAGLVYSDHDGQFEMHELLADAVISSASPQNRNAAYARIDAAYGDRLYLPAESRQFDYSTAASIESLGDLDQSIAYYRSLLDRRLFGDARHVFYESLYLPLRFRLGDLRALFAVLIEYGAARRRADGSEDPSFDNLLGELALFDGRPDEARALLEDAGDTSSDLAEAYAEIGDFDRAYRIAEAACYTSLARLSLTEWVPMRDDPWSEMLVSESLQNQSTAALIEFVVTLRGLCRTLRTGGYPRSATVVALGAVAMVVDTDQPGITSMAYEALGDSLLELGHLEEAESCARQAIEHGQVMMVAEHLLNAEALLLRIRARCGDGQYVSEHLEGITTWAAASGFGRVARDCFHSAADLELVGAAVSDAADWRFSSNPHHETLWPTLAGELRDLGARHPRGRWIEMHLLRVSSNWKRSSTFLDGIWRTALGGGGPADVYGQVRQELHLDATPSEGVSALEHDISDVRALRMVVGHHSDGVGDDLYGLFADGVMFDPANANVRRCLVASAIRRGAPLDAVRRLTEILDAGVHPVDVALDLANALRGGGKYRDAAEVADFGHRHTVDFMPRPALYIATVIGFGLDRLASGDARPKAVADLVAAGMRGRPLTVRFTNRDASRPAFRRLGEAGSDEPRNFERFGAMWQGSRQESMMMEGSRLAGAGVPGDIAVRMFRAYCRGRAPGRPLRPLDGAAVVREGLALLFGHDTAIEGLLGHLGPGG
ncbi:hypothetical protein ACLQ3H_24075 [Micromonospora saelicesensis]|uniref:tetratricopeptide repeat protein n=1 Tax=Micromonospora saelicesensis TaxID=285676 RepID=UPI003CEC0F9D